MSKSLWKVLAFNIDDLMTTTYDLFCCCFFSMFLRQHTSLPTSSSNVKQCYWCGNLFYYTKIECVKTKMIGFNLKKRFLGPYSNL